LAAAPAIGSKEDTTMLIITRRPGEKIVLGDDVVVTLMEISGQTARIGIDAPQALPVYREEIWAAVKEENEAAASADVDALPPTTPQA
jgi:carbon storage regulator